MSELYDEYEENPIKIYHIVNQYNPGEEDEDEMERFYGDNEPEY